MADRYYSKIKKSFDDVKYKLQFTAMELKLKNNENDISSNLKKIETNEKDIASNLTKIETNEKDIASNKLKIDNYTEHITKSNKNIFKKI